MAKDKPIIDITGAVNASMTVSGGIARYIVIDADGGRHDKAVSIGASPLRLVVSVEQEEDAAPDGDTPLADLTVKQIKAVLAEREIEIPKGVKRKDDLIALIVAADEAKSDANEGDPDPDADQE
jgi:hypothetical protein